MNNVKKYSWIFLLAFGLAFTKSCKKEAPADPCLAVEQDDFELVN